MAELHFTDQGTPQLPQAGKTKLYVDSADSHLKQIDSNGVIIDLTETALSIRFQMINNSGGLITKGSAVKVDTFDDINDLPEMVPAEADNPAKMPAIGIIESDAANGVTGFVTFQGSVSALDTTAFAEGDELFVSKTTGVLTNIRPTGGDTLIQSIGSAGKIDASLGTIVVHGALRSNALPNIGEDKLWLGDANGYPQQVDKSAVGATNWDELIDTPNTKVGQALKLVRVNAIETLLEYFEDTSIKAGGAWAEGTHLKNTEYTENGWLGYPTVDTTDHLEPQTVGSPEDSIVKDAFPTSSDTSVVRMVHEFTITKDCFIQALQVMAPTWDTDSISKITIFNVTAGTVTIIDNPILQAGQFVTLKVGNSILLAGTQIEVWFEFYNSTAANAIDGGWTTNLGTGAPASQQINMDNLATPTVVEIHHTDLDSGDRSTELDGVVSGSIIRITETQSTDRNIEFEVDTVDTAAANSTKYTVLAGSITNGPSDVRSGRTSTTHIDVPISQPTVYGVKTGYYPAGNPSWGTITTELYYGGVQQAGTVDGYPINLICQQAYVSPDWRILAFSSSGSAGGTTSPLNTKGDLYTYGTSDTRLAIGTDGQKLVADSAEPTGLKWVDDTGGSEDTLLFSNDGTLTGMTTTNDTTNVWITTTASTIQGTNSLCISNNGTSANYSVNTANVSHIETNSFTISANAKYAWCKIRWQCNGEGAAPINDYDFGRAFIALDSFTPVAGTLHSSGASIDHIGTIKYQLSTETRESILLLDVTELAKYAGNLSKLVFTWVNDVTVGAQPPWIIGSIEMWEGTGKDTVLSMVYAERSFSTQSLFSGVPLIIIYNQVLEDSAGDYDLTGGAGDLTFKRSGEYAIFASIQALINPSGVTELRILRNGSVIDTGGSYVPSAATAKVTVSTTDRFTEGDTITIQASQVSGFTASILTSGTTLRVVRIGD